MTALEILSTLTVLAALVAANYTEDFVTEPERRAQRLPLLGVL